MKVKIETWLDTESGDYEMKFTNISNPGEFMDYTAIQSMLKKVFVNADKQIYDGHDQKPVLTLVKN